MLRNNYGSGFKRILTEIKQYPTMHLECKEIPNGFLVELSYTKQKTILSTKTANKIISNDTDNDTDSRIQKILSAIKGNNQISMTKLAKRIEVSKSTILRDIEKLKKQGKLKRIGNEKNGHWELI